MALGVVPYRTGWEPRNTGVKEAIVEAKREEHSLGHERSDVAARCARRDGVQRRKTDVAVLITRPGRISEPSIFAERESAPDGNDPNGTASA
jgi:hypothetical protein